MGRLARQCLIDYRLAQLLSFAGAVRGLWRTESAAPHTDSS